MNRGAVNPELARVSIPRSEFCGFRLLQRSHTQATISFVSIPRSEFCGFRLLRAEFGGVRFDMFQFLDRNSVDLDPPQA